MNPPTIVLAQDPMYPWGLFRDAEQQRSSGASARDTDGQRSVRVYTSCVSCYSNVSPLGV